VTRQALRHVSASIRAARQLNPNDLTARLPLTGAGDEIDLLAATINDLLERLARYHEQAARFTADASHELRGPLAAIRAGIEVSLQQPRSADDYRESLETIGEQVHRLTDLVNKLLLLARADAGQIELKRERVDLAELIGEAVEAYQPLALDVREPQVREADREVRRLEVGFERGVDEPQGDRPHLDRLLQEALERAGHEPHAGSVGTASGRVHRRRHRICRSLTGRETLSR
jgi:signal transduction histidine kinase